MKLVKQLGALTTPSACYHRSGCCRPKSPPTHRQIFTNMEAGGITPNGFTFGAMIKAYNKKVSASLPPHHFLLYESETL